MSQTTGLVLESGYRPMAPAPAVVVERSFPVWTIVVVVLAAMAAFAPSLAVALAADVRRPDPAACTSDGDAGDAGGVAASAASRRATTEAVIAGHAPGEGAC